MTQGVHSGLVVATSSGSSRYRGTEESLCSNGRTLGVMSYNCSRVSCKQDSTVNYLHGSRCTISNKCRAAKLGAIRLAPEQIKEEKTLPKCFGEEGGVLVGSQPDFELVNLLVLALSGNI